MTALIILGFAFAVLEILLNSRLSIIEKELEKLKAEQNQLSERIFDKKSFISMFERFLRENKKND